MGENGGKVFTHREENLRLGEFDVAGVLYHANYYHLYETAREKLLEHHGLPYTKFVEENSHLAIVEAHQHFLAPVPYGAPISISIWVTDIRRSSFVFQYRIDSLDLELHRGWTKMAYITQSSSGFRTGRLPENLLRILEVYEHT